MKYPTSPRGPRLAFVFVACLSVAVFFIFRQAVRHDSSAGSQPPGSISSDSASEAAAPEAALSGKASDRVPREADRLLAAEGASTDVSLATFPIKEYQHQAVPGGKAAGAPAGEAYIHVPSAGRRVAMEANQLGEFPTVETELRDTVGVRLALDNVKPGTPVRVIIMDGGSFPAAEGVSQVLNAADWRGVAFEFTTSPNIGTHRVLVQALGQPSCILDFNAIEAKDS